MTHANIQTAKNLIGDVLCISTRLGKYCACVSFFGATENLLVDIYMNAENTSRLFKTYHFGMNDPDFEEKAELCMREMDCMAKTGI